MKWNQYVLRESKGTSFYPFDGSPSIKLSKEAPPKVFGSKTTAGHARMKWEEKNPEIMLDILPVTVTTLETKG